MTKLSDWFWTVCKCVDIDIISGELCHTLEIRTTCNRSDVATTDLSHAHRKMYLLTSTPTLITGWRWPSVPWSSTTLPHTGLEVFRGIFHHLMADYLQALIPRLWFGNGFLSWLGLNRLPILLSGSLAGEAFFLINLPMWSTRIQIYPFLCFFLGYLIFSCFLYS